MITCDSKGIVYKCDKCLTPCEKATIPTKIGNYEVWELCDKCKERIRDSRRDEAQK
jgi:hypothetical protein